MNIETSLTLSLRGTLDLTAEEWFDIRNKRSKRQHRVQGMRWRTTVRFGPAGGVEHWGYPSHTLFGRNVLATGLPGAEWSSEWLRDFEGTAPIEALEGRVKAAVEEEAARWTVRRS